MAQPFPICRLLFGPSGTAGSTPASWRRHSICLVQPDVIFFCLPTVFRIVRTTDSIAPLFSVPSLTYTYILAAALRKQSVRT
jgi:hypothetical protein